METVEKEDSHGARIKLVLSSSSRFTEKVLVDLLESQDCVSGIFWG
jgi:hypothetical protein